jgi:broad specificity phosphatase PhoE
VESETQFLTRVETSLDEIQALHGHTDHSVAMVVHGDYIDQCINHMMGVERIPVNYKNAWVANWVFHNTSISRIDIVNGSRNVVYLNRIDHLPVDLVTW